MIALLTALAHAGTLETLRARDDAGCFALGAATPELRAELATLAESDVQPPWAPMRAATCLVTLFPDAETATRVLPWMADPERAGLALVVVSRLDLLPVADGATLARAALLSPDGRHHARVVRRLEASQRPEIRALVVTP